MDVASEDRPGGGQAHRSVPRLRGRGLHHGGGERLGPSSTRCASRTSTW
ncbi:MAG: hypothetical protein MZV65_17110 [Chromatiales bacterium]|nr:hypothetical protein [Chromatiales bacterium]